MGEVVVSLQRSGNLLMKGELLAVIGGESENIIQPRLELLPDSRAHLRGPGVIDLLQQRVARETLSQRNNGLAVPFAHNGVAFPVADPLATLYDGRALADTVALRD